MQFKQAWEGIITLLLLAFNVGLTNWFSEVWLPMRGCGASTWHWGVSQHVPSPGHFGVVYHGEYTDEAQNRIHCAIKSLSRKWGRGWASPCPCCATPSLSDP